MDSTSSRKGLIASKSFCKLVKELFYCQCIDRLLIGLCCYTRCLSTKLKYHLLSVMQKISLKPR
jgi:hypothetical protein